MITVPICTTCDRGTSLDDEYFRTILAFRHDVSEHPDIIGGVQRAALRSFARPEGRGHFQDFIRQIKEFHVRTPAGLHVGKVTGYRPDTPRLLREIERITRGLFYYERREVLGLSCVVKIFQDDLSDWEQTFRNVTDEHIATFKRVVAHVAATQSKTVGRAFEYRHWHPPEDERTSAWLLTFYNRMTFFCLTANATNPAIGFDG